MSKVDLLILLFYSKDNFILVGASETITPL